jgi:exportin-T
LRTRHDVWAIGLQLFTQSQHTVSRNFGLTLLKEYLCGPNPQVQARLELRNTLPQWLRYSIEQNQLGQEAPYLRAGAAHILTLMIKCDYPENWPSAFDDLLDITAQGGEPAVDVMLQILKEMQDEIVTFSSTRTESEALHNTAIKDAMRATNATERIVALLYEVLSAPDQHTEDVVGRAIGVLQDFAVWVPINLIVNDQFVPLLYAFLEHANPTLRSGAAGCWKEIVLRGMDQQSKLELLQSVRMVDVLQRVRVDDDTVGAVVDFASASFEHILAITAELTNQVQAGSDVGVMLSSLLQLSLHLVLQCLGNDELEGNSKISSAIDAFVTVLKQQAGEQADGQLFVAMNELPNVLMAICNRMRYDEDFQFDMDDEDEAEEEALKHYLRKTFVNVARVYPSVCLDLITSVLCSLPQPLSTSPFPDIEVALRLMYHFGEAAKGKTAALQQSTFPSLVVALHESDVDQHRHWAVLLAYYDVCARYSSILTEHPNLLEKVIGDMLGPGGLRSEQATLRSRSSYNLLKILESAGQFAVPYLAPIMQAVQGTFLRFCFCSHAMDLLVLLFVVSLLFGCGHRLDGCSSARSELCMRM